MTDDYIKREDAIAEFVTNGSATVYGIDNCKAIVSRLQLVPSADAVEVVRCRDCKYMLQYEQIKACCNVNSFLQEPKFVEYDDYCSRGERKDD